MRNLVFLPIRILFLYYGLKDLCLEYYSYFFIIIAIFSILQTFFGENIINSYLCTCNLEQKSVYLNKKKDEDSISYRCQ